MDESEFKAVYNTVNSQGCVFEKAMLTRLFGCEKLIKMNIAEREAAGCTDGAAQQQCAHLLDLLRHNAQFVLKLTQISGPLPHAKELKVQCGGLNGLQKAANTDGQHSNAENVFDLVEAAKTEFGSLEQFPYSAIVQSIANFAGRKRRQGK